jgi:hypothetical protein
LLDWLTRVLDRLPESPCLPTLDEHVDALEAIRARCPGRVRRTRIGASAAGKPIYLYSVGTGRQSILIVGGPHPNEPTGALAVQFLLDTLANEPTLDIARDATWHFIGCIDPDGHIRNEAWMSGQRTVDRYLRHFFRPALADQPEYSFPLSLQGYSFDSPSPENRAWQQALEIARPAVQVSMHNSEVGGAFFLLSDRDATLTALLCELPARFDVTLSDLGEPFAECRRVSRGVFELPDIASFVRVGQVAVVDAWSAGESSAGFARVYGTRSLVPEAPMWDHPALRDDRPGTLTLRDVLTEQSAWLERCTEGTNELLASLIHAIPDSEAIVRRSLLEAANFSMRQHSFLRTLLDSDSERAPEVLPGSDALSMRLQLRLVSLRGPAMLARCAEQLKIVEISNAAVQLVEDGLRSLDEIAELKPVPLRSAVGIQCGAALAVAASLAK